MFAVIALSSFCECCETLKSNSRMAIRILSSLKSVHDERLLYSSERSWGYTLSCIRSFVLKALCILVSWL